MKTEDFRKIVGTFFFYSGYSCVGDLQKIRFMARIENGFPPDVESRARFERGDFAASRRRSDFDHIEDLTDTVEDEQADPQFLRAHQRVPVRKGPVTKKTARRLRWAMISIAIIACSLTTGFSLVYYGTHSWRFRIDSSEKIETSGLAKVTRAQLMSVMGSDIGRNIFKVPLEERRRQIEDVPWVESATITRMLPDKLRIHVLERKPVAFVRIGSRVSLIDASGVVMEVPRKKMNYSFPVITGMLDSEPLSTRAARMKSYVRLVGDLDSNGLNYSKDLSEVDLSDPEDVKITVEDAGGALVVHLGSSDFLERYRVYIGHVNEWRRQFRKLHSVDLRFNGQIVVNPETRDEQVAKRP